MRRRTVAVLTAAGVAAIFLAGGCGYEETMCSPGNYPVKAVHGFTGGTCVPDGEAPPAGYVRYPEGKVPKIVGDNWHRYWHEHMLDGNGRELSADQVNEVLYGPCPSPCGTRWPE